jgi:hypothetical protein
MAKLYTRRPGVALSVAAYGVAYNETPLVVPASVGLELEALVEDGEPVFRVEWPEGEREAAETERAAQEAVATAGAGNVAEAAAPFHAEGGKVHHIRTDCTTGNDVEPENRREGTGDLPLCPKCKRLAKASAQE